MRAFSLAPALAVLPALNLAPLLAVLLALSIALNLAPTLAVLLALGLAAMLALILALSLAPVPAVLLALQCTTACSITCTDLQHCWQQCSHRALHQHLHIFAPPPAVTLAPRLARCMHHGGQYCLRCASRCILHHQPLAAPVAVPPPRQVPTFPVDDGVGVGLSGHEGQAGQPAALVPQHQRHGRALLRAGRDVGERGDSVGTAGLGGTAACPALPVPALRPALPSCISNEY